MVLVAKIVLPGKIVVNLLLEKDGTLVLHGELVF